MPLTKDTRALQADLEGLAIDTLSQGDALALAKRLRSVVRRHDHRYYVEDDPLIADREYDRLYRTLKTLEAEFPEAQTEDSPTQRVGGPPIDDFQKHEHPKPLLSLSNAFDRTELREWYERCQRGLADRYGTVEPAVVAELKIDGVAIALTYDDGTLSVAATRGDGSVGEDVTHNIRTVHRIPLRIPVASEAEVEGPEHLEVRGEVFMRKSEFDALNERLVEEGEQPFANPRNAAAGTLRQLDPGVVADRPLSFFAFAVGSVSDNDLATHTEVLDVLDALGFPLESHTKRFEDLEPLLDFCEQWPQRRDELDYEVDGVVVKIDRHEYRDELGTIADAPRWAVAYKFPAREATTTLQKIRVQVGRTGAVNPEAVLDPVEIGGVTVSKATLHNEDYIRERDIREGDTVVVKRAGDVIPQVVRTVPDARTGDEEPWTFPATCPACDTELVRLPDEADHVCPNSECPAQFKRLVEHFVQRDAMDIEGLGERLSHRLVDLGLVTTLADIYRIETDDLTPLDGFANKSAENLVTAIEASKDRSLSRLLFGLGIQHVGKTVAELVVRHCASIEALAATSAEDLDAIDGIGPTIAESIVDWFAVPENRTLVDDLASEGVNTHRQPHEAPLEADEDALPLAGCTIVLTGSLPDWTRADASDAIERAGGSVTSSVSGNTDLLVVGANPGSKLASAREEGTAILEVETAEEFQELLDQGMTEVTDS
ncbi:MAG: DNA ligase (NAD(+)) LigA [Bacteroidetes bacterium SW_9_63_38]|nr:MAG: DNA ligase (NAD(+)) LigA [Bacteroidetes bacterium SW_9_63_38]